MKNASKNEVKIALISIIGAGIITAGFVISQGNIKSKNDNYVSNIKEEVQQEESTELTYKVVNEDLEKYTVVVDKELENEELNDLVKKVLAGNPSVEDYFEIYIFTNEENAKNFDGKKENIETRVTILPDNRFKLESYLNMVE
mgnify:FL=1